MGSTELLITFIAATVSYAIVPGPGTVYVAAQVIMRESGSAVRAAIWGALGLHVGGYAIVIGTAAGLTVLFSAVPVIYEVLKLVGAGYLVWLGVLTLLDRPVPEKAVRRESSSPRYPATFSQGVLVEILNPTTAVFYIAFLPQFIAPAGELPVWSQFLVLGVVVNLIFSLGDVFTIFIAAKMKSGVERSALGRRLFGWLGGGVLITLGLRLAIDRT